uniref:Jacalin-type lectin domain-containing protein n=1 Tax=Esox lucius TaxID=8010 RepID=A0A6Q2Z1E7_ESOLU
MYDEHFCFRLPNMATLLYLIGGQGGGPFELTGRDNGATLKKIGVAVEGWQIKAVRAELTDGLDEHITKLSLWGNSSNKYMRLGGIRFWTSTGREFFQHMNSWPLKTEYSIDVGSGVCLGLQGRCGADIDCMGFLFISPIRTSVLTDMHYPNLAMITPQVRKEYIKSVSYHNNTTAPQDQTIQYSRTVTKKSSWTTTNKIESTLSVSVKAGIPDLVEVSTGWSLTVGHEQSSSMSNQETITEADTTTVKIPPGKTVTVEMSVGRAVIDLAYSAVVKVTCLNGSELVFPSTGNYNGVTYTSVTVNTTESDKVMNVN